jgi:hypothetical protein
MATLRECEQCKTTADWGDSLLEWWQLKLPGLGGRDELDFCSWECVREFAAAHPEASTLPEGH